MFHFFKKKPLVIDCLISEKYAAAAEYTPIQRSGQFIPKWFKDLPGSRAEVTSIHSGRSLVETEFTARSCPGIINQLTKGFILPMWSDLTLCTHGQDFRYQFSDQMSGLVAHSNAQAAGFMENQMIFKLESPWLLRASKPMQVSLQPCFYNHSSPLPYTIFPGIFNTYASSNIAATNIFFSTIISNSETVYNIKLNTPLQQFIPFTEDRISINTVVVSNSEWMRYYALPSTNLSYIKNYTTKQNLCPYRRRENM